MNGGDKGLMNKKKKGARMTKITGVSNGGKSSVAVVVVAEEK